jgi:hypothetical protein
LHTGRRWSRLFIRSVRKWYNPTTKEKEKEKEKKDLHHARKTEK